MNSVVEQEVVGKLPYLSRTGHVDDVDVNILRTKTKPKQSLTAFS